MSDPPAQRVIDALAERLQRSVVIDDPSVVLLYASRHYGDEDEVRTNAVLQRRASSAAVGHVLAQGVDRWTSPGVIPPSSELGMHARVCLPIRWRGELIALLLVVDADGSITTSELSAITQAGEELAPMLAAERAPDAAGNEDPVRSAVGDLVLGNEHVRRAALRMLSAHVDLGNFEHARVIVLKVREGPRGASESHMQSALRYALDPRNSGNPAGTLLTTMRERDAAVVLGSARRPLSERQASTLAGRLTAKVRDVAADRFVCVAGIGSEVNGIDRVWASHQQASLACRAVGDAGRRVRSWAELGPLALLLRLPVAQLPIEALPAEMQRVIAADRDGRLQETLRVFLDHAGAIPATADALHIHRTTLYYRLEKLADAAGIDLSDGATRLALHMSLKVMDLAQSLQQDEEDSNHYLIAGWQPRRRGAPSVE